MYTCKKCDQEFEKQQLYALHLAIHLQKENAQNYIDEFVDIKRVCEKCGKKFIIKAKKSRRNPEKLQFYDTVFCSRSCANGHKLSDQTKKNISNGLKGKTHWYKDGRTSIKKYCKDCGKEISKKSIHCKECAPKHRCEDLEYCKNISESKKKAAREGRHPGWTTRNIISYPEKFFIEVLKNNNLEYKFNHPVNKTKLGIRSSANYFLDFFFENKKIDLEIDGKQHEWREEHDEERDELLTKNGYVVYRIKWKSINNDEGKAYIKSEIDKFLDFYYSMPGSSVV